jgi:serine/threonine protein kinase
LQQVIGQGNYTTVYAARPLGCPPSWPADYVVKVLRVECLEHPQADHTLRREAEIGCRASHPHLVPILEAHMDAELPHLVMPRLDGASLA